MICDAVQSHFRQTDFRDAEEKSMNIKTHTLVHHQHFRGLFYPHWLRVDTGVIFNVPTLQHSVIFTGVFL